MTVDKTRVAELIVDRPAGRLRGSGYRVTANTVLTAAHVVADAVSVQVRFEADTPGEWVADVVSWSVGVGADIAVAVIRPRDGESPVVPAAYASVGPATERLVVHAVGFPLWKLRDYEAGTGKYRDSHQLFGTVAPLSNLREGTFEVETPAQPQLSWEGMSGAALWVADRIVGVITTHHPGDGPGRLAAARLDRARNRSALGLPERLPDISPLTLAEIQTKAYLAQLSSVAPEHLDDRAAELDELAQFCAGEEPYAWWQAGPWSGKTALLSWFVLHPPVGVDVVSFFITNRFAEQSDSLAFSMVVLEQLAALAGESVPHERTSYMQFLRLLHEAATRCAQSGRRLVLVVDGLDEDSSASEGRPTIAALLPVRPPPGVRIIVASRPHPDLPDAVPGDHPLRTVKIRRLTPYARARHIEATARHELAFALRNETIHRDILGLITASGGGLTKSDLEGLTRQPPYILDEQIGGVFGRSLQWRMATHGQVYLFAHETLRVAAEAKFGTALAHYRDQIHEWAKQYRELGWPTATPAYLIRGYPRLLAQQKHVGRLVELAVDRARHDRMLDYSGGDALAFAEIDSALRLVAAQAEPDFVALVRLALARDDLAERNALIPAGLPAAWAALGRPTRAIELAQGISNSIARTAALGRLATALVTNHEDDRAWPVAEDLTPSRLRSRFLDAMVTAFIARSDYDQADRAAHEIPDTDVRDWALCRLAAADPGRADELVHEIGNARVRARALGALAGLSHAAKDHDRAGRLFEDAHTLVENLPEGRDRDWAAGELSRSLALAGRPEQADVVVRRISDQPTQTWFRGELVTIARAHKGDIRPTPADAVRNNALKQALGATPPRPRTVKKITEKVVPTEDARDLVYAGVADVLARRGNDDDAETMIAAIRHPGRRDWARARLALIAGENTERALALAQAIESHGVRAWVLGALQRSTGLDLTGQAEAAARAIDDPAERSRVMSGLASASADCGRSACDLAAEAESTARGVVAVYSRSSRNSNLVDALIAVGDLSTAGRVCHEIISPTTRMYAVDSVVDALIEQGERHQASALAIEAEQRLLQEPGNERALSQLVSILIHVNEYERATNVLQIIRDPRDRLSGAMHAILMSRSTENRDLIRTFVQHAMNALTELGSAPEHVSDLTEALARTGDIDGAIALIRKTIKQSGRISSFAWSAIAGAGHEEVALSLIDEITDPESQIYALCAIAATTDADPELLLARAERAAHELPGHEARVLALCAIAKTIPWHNRKIAAARLTVEAHSTALAIDEIETRVRMLLEILETKYLARDVSGVREIGKEIMSSAAKIPDSFTRTRLHERAARMLGWVGAEEIVRDTIRDVEPAERAELLYVSARSAPRANVSDLHGIALEIPSPKVRMSELEDLTFVALSARRDEQAIRILKDCLAACREISNDHLRRYRLRQLVHRCIQHAAETSVRPETESAIWATMVPLIAEAFGASDWSELLSGVARINPAVLEFVLEAAPHNH